MGEFLRTLRALTDRIDVPFDPPYRDLAGFRAYWGSHDGCGRCIAHDPLNDKGGPVARRRLGEYPDPPRLAVEQVPSMSNTTARNGPGRTSRRAAAERVVTGLPGYG
jgi:hypothetical protein